MSILTPNRPPVRPDPGTPDWRAELRSAVRRPAELAEMLELPAEWAEGHAERLGDFPLLVPRPYVMRMNKQDPRDPLLLQVLPTRAEHLPADGFTADPVGDTAASIAPGLLHKYAGRVLLVTTGACAVHCRYCFRRHFPYEDSPKGLAAWEPALDAIASDASLHEVILSGGDPLTLVDSTLAELVRRIAQIPHVARLRVHTRLPIVIPSRVTSELVSWLTDSRLTPVVVVHANHANELDQAVAEGLHTLSHAGVPLLNQAVLLKGVNDSADAQAALCERLVNLRVMPYYLHQLDKTAGAAHFEAPVETGLRIMEEIRGRLPGYAVPKYVQEVAGGVGKQSLI